MPTVLVTGANRGLGLEFARQYAADGAHVIAACRDPDKAAALKAVTGDVTAVPLDVTDTGSVRRLAAGLSGAPVDVLVNNAGIYPKTGREFGALDFAAWAETFAVNTLAPIRIAEALADAVTKSQTRVMAFVTSQMGSIGDGGGGSYAYRSSKAALNMAVTCLVRDLRPRGIVCLLLHPGWVRTDMGGPSAPLAAPESVRGMRAVIAQARLADSGKFLRYNGDTIPW